MFILQQLSTFVNVWELLGIDSDVGLLRGSPAEAHSDHKRIFGLAWFEMPAVSSTLSLSAIIRTNAVEHSLLCRKKNIEALGHRTVIETIDSIIVPLTSKQAKGSSVFTALPVHSTIHVGKCLWTPRHQFRNVMTTAEAHSDDKLINGQHSCAWPVVNGRYGFSA